MIRLKVPLIPNENTLINLFEKNICTVNDFLQKKSTDLQNVCDLQCKEITKIKDDLTVKCSSPFIDGYVHYLNNSVSSCVQTGIQKLDNLLGGGLFNGNIYELCGQSASGKTQLSFSIMSDVIVTTQREVIYVDTKNEFSVNRIKQILRNKYDLTTNEINAILKKINVYTVLDIYSLMTCLHSIKEKSEPIIIIDSILALYLSFIGFNKNYGLCYMNHICSILKFLCKKNAIILIINLAVKNCNFINKTNEEVPNQNLGQLDFKPAIGKYWIHIPNTRLMLTTMINKHQISVHITKSVYIPLNEKCILNIDDSGVF